MVELLSQKCVGLCVLPDAAAPVRLSSESPVGGGGGEGRGRGRGGERGEGRGEGRGGGRGGGIFPLELT